MVTSFADGSKISFEQAIVANATGFVVQSARDVARPRVPGDVMKIGGAVRHRHGARLGGIVDYVVGPPLTKVFCPGGASRSRSSSTT